MPFNGFTSYLPKKFRHRKHGEGRSFYYIADCTRYPRTGIMRYVSSPLMRTAVLSPIFGELAQRLCVSDRTITQSTISYGLGALVAIGLSSRFIHKASLLFDDCGLVIDKSRYAGNIPGASQIVGQNFRRRGNSAFVFTGMFAAIAAALAQTADAALSTDRPSLYVGVSAILNVGSFVFSTALLSHHAARKLRMERWKITMHRASVSKQGMDSFQPTEVQTIAFRAISLQPG